MFNTYRKALVIAGLVFCLFSSAFAYSGGAGTETEPYKIGTVADWQQLMGASTDWNKYFVMTADVNLSGATLTPVGNPTTTFTGIFDGNDHIISNVVINARSFYVGLFGYIQNATIKNLGIEDVNFSATRNYIGGLCGFDSNSSITNCYSTGIVSGGSTGYYTGGLCGSNTDGNITDCYSICNVSGRNYTGGLCGENYGIITNCYSIGNVNGTTSYTGGLCGLNNNGSITDCWSTGSVTGGYYYTGGLCGMSQTGSIANCYSSSTVSGVNITGGLCGRANDGNIITYSYSTGNVSGGTSTGGLCGSTNSNITYSYSTGNATGIHHTGGFCGKNGGSIANCYSNGNVGGSYQLTGGLCGMSQTGSIANCYSTGTVSGSSRYIGGLCGQDYGSITNCYFLDTAGLDNGLGEPLTDAQMKQQASFTGWDFITPVWEICDGTNYSKLAWQIPLSGDFGCPDGVDIYDVGIFTDQWLLQGDYSADIAPEPDGDGIVDFLDFAVFAGNWLEMGN